MASVHGLEGLSIGPLADRLHMSKSGLFAHFGSKEDLQLATIATAREIFERDVLAPARAAPKGVAQLVALCEAFLSHVERRVFPGGCFFAAAAAEFDSRTGPVRDAVAGFRMGFVDRLGGIVRDAQVRGELHAGLDPMQLAFEIDALLLAANAWFLISGNPEGLQRARAGLDALLLFRAAGMDQ